MTVRPRLAVVPADPARATRWVPKPAAGYALQCQCGSRDVLEVRNGMRMVDGKPRGGTKVLLCAACLMAGRRVVLG